MSPASFPNFEFEPIATNRSISITHLSGLVLECWTPPGRSYSRARRFLCLALLPDARDSGRVGAIAVVYFVNSQ